MKLFLVSVALLGCAAIYVGSPSTAPAAASLLVKSKVEPKEVILSKDSKDPKGKPVLLTHEAHATLKYSRDQKSVVSCAECHHTDQPKAALTGVLKTSEREVLLTSANLKEANAAPVKTCRECHAKADQKPAEWPTIPTVKYPDEDDEVTLTNDEAYHRNCNTCHDDVKKNNPATKAPTTCAGCHNGGVKP
ncbi:MAG TPA: cytochrome c3 family protein [Pyrinomonadaceae bacterium]|jgi:cytochrome c553